MKQIIAFRPLFNPQDRSLDFGLLHDFSIARLYAVINVTRNQIIYAPGAEGLGITALQKSQLTLEFDTQTHSARDLLTVYYEVLDSTDSLQLLDLQNQILVELKIMNQILAQGLNIDNRDLDGLKEEFLKPQTR